VLYLAGYRGNGSEDDPFTPIGSEQPGWSAIDLRPDPTVTAGWALLRVPEPFSAQGVIELGELDEALNLSGSRGVENQLGLPRDSLREKTLRQVIADLLILWGDENHQPNGRWKKLLPDHLGHLKVYLGGLVVDMAVPAGGATLPFFDDFNRPNENIEVSPDWDAFKTNPLSSLLVDNNLLAYMRDAADGEKMVAAVAGVSATNVTVTSWLLWNTQIRRAWELYVRFTDLSNHYRSRLANDITPAVTLRKVVAGTDTALASVDFVPAVNQQHRLEVEGSTLRYRLWDDGAAEPSTWLLEATDTNITDAGTVGLGGQTSGLRSTYQDDFFADTLDAFDPANLAVTMDGTMAQLSWDASSIFT